jgi:ribonuclease HI
MTAGAQGEWLLMVDGAARGNPGEAGCGAVICDETGAAVKELCRYLGQATTNNVAEYEALIMGLEGVLALGGKELRVQSDSELLVRQLNGLYRVKDEKLKKLYHKALGLLQQLETCRIVHVVREQNRLADRLANQAIDDTLKKRVVGLK